MNSISNRFQIDELEQRLEMAEWTLKAEGKVETKQTGGTTTTTTTTSASASVSWGKK